ncbi:MAG TPA: TrbI/VirB10 family protein [Candidatus Thiothrix moscowensis]|uniref:TrbI/VirB10 family protein n=1 Tax=unclassified Thiothrix TaxID=2636184 RepID=UPI0025FEBB8D|nr:MULTISPECIES: TrbI/VirB10 family protein [unclassified Thiothrix]HRJ52234.1 TrbI/VirB10 family protein [Candidatus Thiothrix moscowensis]HRJ92549.1 TrbI/VirB10 family protein [Candidatus Thiothrix moscowensis]
MDGQQNIKRRQMLLTVGVAGVLVAMVIFGLWWSDPGRKLDAAQQQQANTPMVSKQFTTPAQVLDPADVWITRSEATLEEMRKQNLAMQQQVDALTKLVKDGKEGGAGASASLDKEDSKDTRSNKEDSKNEGRDAGSEAAGGSMVLPPVPGALPASSLPLTPPTPVPAARTPVPPANPAGLPEPSPAEGDGKKPGILNINLDANAGAKEVEQFKDKPHTVGDYLPAGSFVSATLLSGLDAPTGGQAQNNPQPVLLRLVDDGTLPNRVASNIRSCHMTAAGYGDISAERAYLRLERMSCVLVNGQVVDKAIKGYVAGEDGKAGIRGLLVSKQGQMIARALVSGVAGGIGSGISDAYSSVSTSATTGTVTTVDPSKIGQFGVANGFGKTLEKVADWYLQRANETYPIIEVASGRSVDIVLTEGFAFETNILANGMGDGEADE